ncbi:sulfotransferase domain-containing protein [Roseiconus lacunae]|uniref:Sulfotransferase domain-containing protein n=1 Tax=Roseiconus lacunae TaxID=2605694 RepID=A0ABT7PCE4_9BACT|nr:sulfotransferase domain-containing protein [Roseiconus lacunae]MDM4014147.1 sulfotransferase domain-containing protein [Roseiconus lacunae]
MNTNAPPKEMFFADRMFSVDETLPGDVFVAGYPKSGNTLLQHIIAHLVFGLNDQVGRTLVQSLVTDLHANSHYFRHREQCFFKTHDVPKARFRNVIYVIRDGREAMLSYYHMLKNMGHDVTHESVFSGAFDFDGKQWHEHVRAWEANPFQANVLWVHYEDMIENKLQQVRRVCEFLNLDRNEQELESVVRLTSLEHMKKVERRSDWKRANQGVFTKPACFVRRGDVDSFRSEVAPEVLAQFEERNQQMLQRFYPEAISKRSQCTAETVSRRTA